jgi:FkbM family methyltransferase
MSHQRTAVDEMRSLVWRGLDRPSSRSALALLSSVYCSVTARAPCRVVYRDGVWIHRFPEGVTTDTRIRQNLPTPARWRETTERNVFFRYRPRPGDVVFDIGAGVGTETFTIAPLVGHEGRVIAFEAHPRTFACLATMVRENGLDNVVVEQKAIAGAVGEIEMGDDEAHISNSAFELDRKTLRVPATTLDHYARMLGVGRVDLLKMNIEGAEAGALGGASELLRRTRHVVVACHDFKANRTGVDAYRTKAQVRARLEAAGFEVFDRRDEERPWLTDTLYAERSTS